MCSLYKTKTVILANKNKEWTGKTFHSQHIILIVANQLLLHSQHIILIVANQLLFLLFNAAYLEAARTIFIVLGMSGSWYIKLNILHSSQTHLITTPT
jgi:hypothetical protein